MGRKSSLTLKRGTTTIIAEGCYAITCLTLMAGMYLLMAGIGPLTQSFTGRLLTHDDE